MRACSARRPPSSTYCRNDAFIASRSHRCRGGRPARLSHTEPRRLQRGVATVTLLAMAGTLDFADVVPHLKAHCARYVEEFEQIRILGMHSSGDGDAVPRSAYQSRSLVVDGGAQRRADTSFSIEEADLLTLLESGGRCLFITGDGGVGKTEWCRNTAYQCACAGYQRGDFTRVPLFVELRQLDVAEPRRGERSWQPLIDQLLLHPRNSSLTRAVSSNQRVVDVLVAEGRLAYMLDGLDELPADQHHQFARQLNSLVVETLGRSTLVLTGRRSSIDADIRCLFQLNSIYEPLGLQDVEIESYIRAYFSGRNPARGEELLSVLRSASGQRMLNLMARPVLLALTCQIFAERDLRLSDRPADFLEEALQHFFHRRQKKFLLRSSKDVLDLISCLASGALQQGDLRLAYSEAEWFASEFLRRRKIPNAPGVADLLFNLADASGILQPRPTPTGPAYEFTSRVLAEYLAARHALKFSDKRVRELYSSCVWCEQLKDMLAWLMIALWHSRPKLAGQIVGWLLRHLVPRQLVRLDGYDTVAQEPDAPSAQLDRDCDDLHHRTLRNRLIKALEGAPEQAAEYIKGIGSAEELNRKLGELIPHVPSLSSEERGAMSRWPRSLLHPHQNRTATASTQGHEQFFWREALVDLEPNARESAICDVAAELAKGASRPFPREFLIFQLACIGRGSPAAISAIAAQIAVETELLELTTLRDVLVSIGAGSPVAAAALTNRMAQAPELTEYLAPSLVQIAPHERSKAIAALLARLVAVSDIRQAPCLPSALISVGRGEPVVINAAVARLMEDPSSPEAPILAWMLVELGWRGDTTNSTVAACLATADESEVIRLGKALVKCDPTERAAVITRLLTWLDVRTQHSDRSLNDAVEVLADIGRGDPTVIAAFAERLLQESDDNLLVVELARALADAGSAHPVTKAALMSRMAKTANLYHLAVLTRFLFQVDPNAASTALSTVIPRLSREKLSSGDLSPLAEMGMADARLYNFFYTRHRKLANRCSRNAIVFVGRVQVLLDRARRLGWDVQVHTFDPQPSPADLPADPVLRLLSREARQPESTHMTTLPSEEDVIGFIIAPSRVLRPGLDPDLLPGDWLVDSTDLLDLVDKLRGDRSKAQADVLQSMMWLLEHRQAEASREKTWNPDLDLHDLGTEMGICHELNSMRKLFKRPEEWPVYSVRWPYLNDHGEDTFPEIEEPRGRGKKPGKTKGNAWTKQRNLLMRRRAEYGPQTQTALLLLHRQLGIRVNSWEEQALPAKSEPRAETFRHRTLPRSK